LGISLERSKNWVEFSLDLMRHVAILCALCFASCAAPPAGEARAVSRPGDPALDGKDYLLSEAEFRALLAVARAHVARETPWFFLHRVHVVSSTEVKIYLGPFDELGEPYMFYASRESSGWRIHGGGEIIHVTEFRSNQALQPTAGRRVISLFGMKQFSILAKLALASGG
jgi:hypothetical protein